MKLPIYLDYMATTPVDPRVIEKMQTCLTIEGDFANPASQTHVFGHHAAERVAYAREQVAYLLKADSREIVFTSGATEANNLALKGAAEFYQRKGKHIVTLKSEHKSVLDTCEFLATKGFEITYLMPQTNGLLDLNDLKRACRDDTILVSLMYVNNETGVIQDIKRVGEFLRDKGIIFHVDAVQAVGKYLIDVNELVVDLLSVSAHKAYGPKGIGALYVRRTPRVRLQPQIHGGGHERGLRSGTLATHQIVGMGEAFAIAAQEFSSETKRIAQLRDLLWSKLTMNCDIVLNAKTAPRVAHCLNVTFKNIDSEHLINALPELAFSASSACTSGSAEPSHVLTAMGVSRCDALCTVRLSLGRFTTREEIEFAANKIVEESKKIISFLKGDNRDRDNT